MGKLIDYSILNLPKLRIHGRDRCADSAIDTVVGSLPWKSLVL